VYLAVPRRTKPPGAVQPRLVSAINALLARSAKLRVLHVKHFNSRMVEIDKLQVVELLQHKMAGIVKQVAAGMLAHTFQEHFKRRAIVQILPRVNFKTKIDPGIVKRIKDRDPPFREFI